MGNANSGNVRDRHKSGDSLPPSSPCGIIKDGQAFTFDKRPSVGTHASHSSSAMSNPSSPAAHMHSSSSAQSQPQQSHHNKVIQLQHSQSNDDDEPSYFTRQPISKSLSKDVSSEDYPEAGRPRAVTVSEGSGFGGSIDRDSSGVKILPTVFKWDGGGKSAFICGTFSDWKTIPMVKSNFTAKDGEDFVAIVDLPEGEHQYKFLIDEEWKFNPQEPTVQTEDGTVNNMITVRKTDFEVFDALAMDQCNSKSSKATQLISGSPPGSEWGQDMPSYKPWEKTTGPPILPPHLLQVILNKDTPLSCEPTLLPEPNHVMLNHLYALSIKDGVMVLSATHRYRKKYVTTLLYKPI